MKCAIMQPTYLPWSGYFNMIAQSDVFVFLDDVQFERRSWQCRNRVLLNSSYFQLGVPVKKAARDSSLNTIEIDHSQSWQARHRSVLSQAYSKKAFYTEMTCLTAPVLDGTHRYIADMNCEFIVNTSRTLGFKTEFIRASELGCGGKRSEHLGEICKKLNADTYLSPLGSKEYLEADNFEENFKIDLQYADFQPRPYTQHASDEFISHLSIVDVVANLGLKSTRDYVQETETVFL